MKIGRFVSSVLACLFGALLIGAGLSGPDDEAAAELESLRTSPVCDSPPDEPAACIWEGEFEFVGSERHEGFRGSVWYSIDLRDVRPDPDGSPGFVQPVESFDHEDIAGLTYRTPVTATVWRGRIIEVRIDGRDLSTDDYPQAAFESTSVEKGALVLFGVVAIAFGGIAPYLQHRRARAAAHNQAVAD
jgi:hypothetical protein